MALPAAAQEAGEQELARRINEIVGQQDAARGFWGIEVYAPQRGRTLYGLNADRYFTPASVTKLFTTAAALSLLSPDYRFRTVVGTRGRIERDGRLAGNLYFVGGGDPDLAGCDLPYDPAKKRDEQICDPSLVLDELAAQVAAKGVQLVSGDLVIDQSFFAPEPYGLDWSIGDMVWSYGAPVRALSLADNVLAVRVEPGEQVNQAAQITWLPFTRFYQIVNRTWTTPPDGETQLYLRRDPGSRVLEISGPIALNHKGRTLWVAIEEPSEFAGELFLRALERRGIRLQGRVDVRYAPAPPFTSEPPGALPVILAERISLPLVEEVRLINKNSQNLHAEMLLRLLGCQMPPPSALTERLRKPNEPPPRRGDGSTEAGLEVLRAWLANLGINPDEVAIRDGSGLARAGLVTPRAVVKLLSYAAAQPWGELYRDTFPVAGLDGTLKERMREAPTRARVRAKTGTLNDANALAGYVETQTGEPLIFAIFVNHHRLGDRRALELMDAICAALVDLPPPSKNGKAKSETRK
ncbi:MAG TPA: D-alanyl-D-alanine carboxypeptidase/D-alanyl-D-alanine-endopeptidase [Candidatus Xenobia bacterium]|nr:D-alanyl-D-alanine carboxypeptidase/D-alanyl-D-alanine-endopeptidase [Candidatus Xenobia bacterium]